MDDLKDLIPLQYDDGEEEQIWVKKKPKRADHIRVWRGTLYTHHGIYVSEDEVIHFASRDSDNLMGGGNEVIKTDLKTFLRGGTLEVKVYNSEELPHLNPPDIIVKIARSLIGDDGYNLIFNNCEHFANFCTLGEHRSLQVEKVLKPLKRRNNMWLFGNREKRITTTVYEPDKVRVAEIENKTKILLKELEARNIRLKADMQKEIVSHLVEEEKVLIEAKIEGFNSLLNYIAEFNKQLLELRIEKNLEIEKTQSENIKKINEYYDEIERNIDEKDKNFALEYLPKLYEQLEKYDPNTDSYSMYKSFIEKRMEEHLLSLTSDIKYFREQKNIQLAFSNELRRILEIHLNEMNKKMLSFAKEKSSLISLNKNETSLLEHSKNSFTDLSEEAIEKNGNKEDNNKEITVIEEQEVKKIETKENK